MGTSDLADLFAIAIIISTAIAFGEGNEYAAAKSVTLGLLVAAGDVLGKNLIKLLMILCR